MRSLDSLYRSLGQVVLPLCLLLMVKLVMAQTGAGFDHDATAFPLLGSHQQVRCESCHIKGIFKATPRDCAGCHVVNNQRGAMAMPYKHIQTSSTCDTCHNSNSFAAVLFTHVNVMPGTCNTCHDGNRAIGQPAGHFPTNLSCDACHVTSVFKPVRQFPHAVLGGDLSSCASCHNGLTATGMPANHLPRTSPAQCGNCHINSTLNGFMSFSGGQMDHTGMGSGCADCHGPSITGSSFAGISSIVVMPPTSPAGANSHIPSSITCESCHLASMPAGLISANASLTPPGSGFATPPPGNAQIHAGVTGGCSSCHETNSVWMSVGNYPISPSTLVAKAQYTGFQTRPQAAAGTYNIADAAHPSSGDCGQCHGNTNYFSSEESRPANHIPISTSAQCNSCHTTSDFSVLPSLANIHANAPSTTGNCAQCHAANVVAGFAIPAANFTIVGPPANHLPTTAACESCHVGSGSSIASLPVGNGAKFSGSLMSHTGITSNCVSCHGPGITGSSFAGVSNIVVMPATSPVGTGSHIPSSTTCESCHLGTVPSGLVAASATKSAPGTLFATPAPTTTQIHTGITSGCSSCHDTNYVWMGVTAYPIAPTVLTSGAQYTGFQTRPKAAAGTFNIADVVHPSTGDCGQCHGNTNYFTAVDKPANHIPTLASAQCNSCHTTTDFSVLPSLANIHANAPSTTGNCAQCHAANVVAGFAIPAANFTIVGPPANHLPTTAACESCHVGSGSSIASLPVGNGAKFSGSLMSHTGITSNCVSCHGPGITGSSFAGVSNIVVMPATSPVGTGSHIPSSTTCESCHLGTVPSGLVAASATKSAPGTLFATPAPTTTQIHTGITSGCSSCHDTNYVWMGVTAYPIAPTVLTSGAQYTGFQTRPKAAAGTYNIADAAHPATGDCSLCHTGTNYFSGAAKPTGHIPTTQSCATCHLVSGDFSIAGLASTTALHTGISSGCITCHSAGAGAGPFAGCTTQAACASPPPVTYQPKVTPLAAGGSPTAPSASTHVPTVGISCEKCHSATVFTSFVGMNMKGNTAAHTAVGAATCESCHEYPYVWYGVTIKTPGSTSHHGRAAGQDCTACHNKSYSQFSGQARVRPVLRGALNPLNQRFLPGIGLVTSALFQGNLSAFTHTGVLPGQCQTCHNGQMAQGMPARHLLSRLSCDSCHRTTAWKPAQFNHQGVIPGQCQSCHNSAVVKGKPAGHFVTAKSCDACHRTVTWVPVSYSHISPSYQPQVGKFTCVSCHVTNGELIPRQMRGNNRPSPVPVRTVP